MTRDPSAFSVLDQSGLVLAQTPFVPAGLEGPGLSEQDALALAELIASMPDLITQMHLANFARDETDG